MEEGEGKMTWQRPGGTDATLGGALEAPFSGRGSTTCKTSFFFSRGMLNSVPQGHLKTFQQGRSLASRRGLELLALPQSASLHNKEQDPHTTPLSVPPKELKAKGGNPAFPFTETLPSVG